MAACSSTSFRICPHNMSCEYYLEMKKNQYSTEALLHLDVYRHEKIWCSDGQGCPAFIRLKENGHQQEDVGHCAIYFHNRRSGLVVEENMESTKFVSAFLRWGLDGRTTECRVSTNLGKEGDLVLELNKNGFDHTLVVKGGPYTSLIDVAHEKLKHPRHVEMGSPLNLDQMLAILLYTNTSAYADLRRDEIRFCQQNPCQPKSWCPQKWPIFGALLDSAIRLLDKYDDKDNRPPIVYHGLQGIEIDKCLFNNHSQHKIDDYFKYGTFVSTSWDIEVARSFMGEKGCLLVIDTTDQPGGHERLVGADVSWISKFPVEGEFLIARKPTFEIIDIKYDPEQKCQLVMVANGDNLHANSD